MIFPAASRLMTNMLTRLFGGFDIQMLNGYEISKIENKKLYSDGAGFESELGRKGYDIKSHSTTSWYFYAKDVVDKSCNIVRFEPRYLEESPPLVPNIGLKENVYETRIEDAKRGKTLIYYPGDYKENPYGWSEKELKIETDRHMRNFTQKASKVDGHFLSGKNIIQNIKKEESDVYIIFGRFRRRDVWSVFVLVADSSPFALRSDSEAANHWHIDNHGLMAASHPSQWDMMKVCRDCESETLHKRVNHRNSHGEYFDKAYECQNCGRVTRRLEQ